MEKNEQISRETKTSSKLKFITAEITERHGGIKIYKNL